MPRLDGAELAEKIIVGLDVETSSVDLTGDFFDKTILAMHHGAVAPTVKYLSERSE